MYVYHVEIILLKLIFAVYYFTSKVYQFCPTPPPPPPKKNNPKLTRVLSFIDLLTKSPLDAIAEQLSVSVLLMTMLPYASF